MNQAVLAKNDRLAERNRGYFRAKGLLVLNMVSAPGSGKTTFIQKTATALGSRLKTGVIVGDLATDNDAARLRSAGVPVVQITTGTVCHLEAEMVARAMSQLDLGALNLLIIENVGNLVCPAEFKLGEDLKVMILSVAEGHDKPLKYPLMFSESDVLIVNKIDLIPHTDFDMEALEDTVLKMNSRIVIFKMSCRTGEGVDAWISWLSKRVKER